MPSNTVDLANEGILADFGESVSRLGELEPFGFKRDICPLDEEPMGDIR